MSTLREEIAARRATHAAEASFIVASSSAATLVVSTWQGETWVLPWSQLACARFTGTGGNARLELSFPQYFVVIHGRKLRGLLADLAALRISTIRDFPPDFRPPADASQPYIARIEVSALATAATGISESSH